MNYIKLSLNLLFLLAVSQCGQVGTEGIGVLDQSIAGVEEKDRYTNYVAKIDEDYQGQGLKDSRWKMSLEILKSQLKQNEYDKSKPEEGLAEIAGMFVSVYKDENIKTEAQIKKAISDYLGSVKNTLVIEDTATTTSDTSTEDQSLSLVEETTGISQLDSHLGQLSMILSNQAIVNLTKYDKDAEASPDALRQTVFMIVGLLPSLKSSEQQEFINKGVATMLVSGATPELYSGLIGAFTRIAKSRNDLTALSSIGQQASQASAYFGEANAPLFTNMAAAAMLDELDSIEEITATTEGILSADVGDSFNKIVSESFKKMRAQSPDTNPNELFESLVAGACKGVKQKLGSDQCSDLSSNFTEILEELGGEFELDTDRLATFVTETSPASVASDDESTGSGDSTDSGDSGSSSSDTGGEEGGDSGSSGDEGGGELVAGTRCSDFTCGPWQICMERESVRACEDYYGEGALGTQSVSADLNLMTAKLGKSTCPQEISVFEVSTVLSPGTTEIAVDLPSGVNDLLPDNDCIQAGDEIMLYIAQGGSTVNTGFWETHEIASIESPDTAPVLKLTTPIRSFFVGTDDKVRVQTIPHYENLTVASGANLTVSAWDGDKGGALVFRVKDQLTVEGNIELSSLGYRVDLTDGAIESWTGMAAAGGGLGAEPTSQEGTGNTRQNAGDGFDNRGGGGGAGCGMRVKKSGSYSAYWTSANGIAGTGYEDGGTATTVVWPTSSSSSNYQSCYAGYGGTASHINVHKPDLTPNFPRVLLGSGGGMGASADSIFGGGTTGAGGGALIVTAQNISVSGEVRSLGTAGGAGDAGVAGTLGGGSCSSAKAGYGGNAGGQGSDGGLIFMQGDSVTLDVDTNIKGAGGVGGAGGAGGLAEATCKSGDGGAGASGTDGKDAGVMILSGDTWLKNTSVVSE